MALVLCKGKPYSPPVLHGYTFECRGPENEFPGPDTLWGADVEEKDFHKFLLGVEGSPFFLEDTTVVIPPPPPPVTDAGPVAVPPIPGAVPTADSEAAAALQRSAIASGALEPLEPGPSHSPDGGQNNLPDTPGPDAQPPADGQVPPPASPVDLRAVAYEPYSVLRSKADIATLAKAELGLEMDPDNSKMADMLEAVKAAIAERIPPLDTPPQA